jgi:superoxide dismutase
MTLLRSTGSLKTSCGRANSPHLFWSWLSPHHVGRHVQGFQSSAVMSFQGSLDHQLAQLTSSARFAGSLVYCQHPIEIT